MAARLREQYGSDYPAGAGWALRAISLHDDLVGEVRPALIALLAAVGLVLLIVCANVANLMLARSTTRQREIAIRQALGAGRWRVTRQLLTESVLLGGIGGGVGVVLAIWGVEALTALGPANFPRLHAISIDRMALAFAAGISLVTSVLFGFAPAVHGSRTDLQSVMRETTPARGSSRLRGALIVAEFALALVLLVGAALLVQTVWRLQGVELGFNPQSVLTARLWLPQPNDPSTGPYFTHRARVQFYRQVLDRIATLPGVESSGGVSNLPLGGARSRLSFTIEGQDVSARDVPASELALATPGYFSALGVDLVRGRLFDDHDDERAPAAIVINESFARRFFPGADPVGRRLFLGSGVRTNGPLQSATPLPLTIVGIVRDVRTERLDVPAAPMLYRSVLQASNLNLTLVVRASGNPEVLAESIRREVRAADPNEPVFGVRTMDEIVAGAVGQRRFAMLLLVLFAVVALVLAAIGIYGVMAYFVSHRAREIGIRMALGASSRDILTMVIAQGARLTVAGVAIGLAGALAVTGAISTLLYGVGPRDPMTLILLSTVLACVALVACYVPARRATRIDPIHTLRRD
jgi:predicted permease